MSTEADAPSPTVLAGRYRLERRVAQGGMAEVWLATDTALSRQVAVKLLKPSLAADPVVAERFRREAIAVASVTHPNIVAVYDAVEDNGRQAVVMQYVQGKTLRQLLDEQRKLSPELTVHIGAALAAALDAAHAAGLVHRDVKPGNVLVTPDGRVQLADFGIAKALGSGDDLTSDNVMMGTAKYLSPEQVRGRKLDGRADLYSLGLVLYECLAGRVPFLGETDADTALARLQRDATDLSSLRPTLPQNLSAVVHRLMEREPEDRYPTGAAVKAALTGAMAGHTPPTTISTTPSGGTSRPTGRQPVVPPPKLFDAADHDPDLLEDRRDQTRSRSNARATGTVPVVDPDATYAPHLDPILAGSSTRDRTPAGAPVVTPRHPRSSKPSRLSPSLVVLGVLLLLAFIVGVVIWSSIQSEDGGVDTPSDDSIAQGVGPAATNADTGRPNGAQSGAGTAPQVVGISVYDPDGDSVENNNEARNAVDGDPSTSWHTVCYQSEYFGGKRGVGLVVALDRPSRGTVTVDVSTGPWIVQVFGVEGNAPSDLEAWGDPLMRDFGEDPDTVTVGLGNRAVQNVLVLMKQGAPSDACSEDNPNRGGIAEIAVTED